MHELCMHYNNNYTSNPYSGGIQYSSSSKIYVAKTININFSGNVKGRVGELTSDILFVWDISIIKTVLWNY